MSNQCRHAGNCRAETGRQHVLCHVDLGQFKIVNDRCAIHRMGRIMGLRTAGEFADSPALIDALRSIGVGCAQGDGLQRPQALPPPGPSEPGPSGRLAGTAPIGLSICPPIGSPIGRLPALAAA